MALIRAQTTLCLYITGADELMVLSNYNWIFFFNFFKKYRIRQMYKFFGNRNYIYIYLLYLFFVKDRWKDVVEAVMILNGL
jgi:hypothetical protein